MAEHLLRIQNPTSLVLINISENTRFEPVECNGLIHIQALQEGKNPFIIIDDVGQYCRGPFVGHAKQFAPYVIQEFGKSLTFNNQIIVTRSLYHLKCDALKHYVTSWQSMELKNNLRFMFQALRNQKTSFNDFEIGWADRPQKAAFDLAFDKFCEGVKEVSLEQVNWERASTLKGTKQKIRAYLETLHTYDSWCEMIQRGANIYLKAWWEKTCS